MHHLWEIPELVFLIFEFLELRDQTRIALVCKTFSIQACNLIWRNVDNFSALAGLLPDGTLTLDENKRFTVARPLASSDWERFADRASTIRALAACISPDHYAVQQEMAAHASRSDVPLFRNLKRLIVGYYPFESDIFNILESFMSPELVDVSVLPVYLSLDNDIRERANTHLRSIVSLLATVPRALHTFTLQPAHELSPHTVHTLIMLFHEVPSIRAVNLIRLSGWNVRTLIPHLADMDALDSLTITPISGPNASDNFPPGFSNLIRLRLSGPMNDILRLISSVTSPNLTSIRFSILTWLLPIQHTCLLAGFERFTRLQFVSSDFGMERVGWEDLKPLLSCLQLRVVHIRCRQRIDLTGELLVAMASAWPNLEDLGLKFDLRRFGGSLIPVYALECLPAKCPGLKHLCVPLNLSVSGGSLPINTFSNGLQALSSLDLRFSGIELPTTDTAAFLTSLCPNVTNLEFPVVRATEEEAIWQDLQNKMEAILARSLKASWRSVDVIYL
ncbi:hypothetical protein FRB99_004313 [Tulasnella sp. 403]|nr:hypothetical protein FRB99_004313 [Tulasnella sp. 403]